MRRNIILTGFSYTGKSAIARAVARRTGWKAVDTDDLIVHRAGRPIAQIFSEDGEDRFRVLEAEVLREACSYEHAVIATGGGAIIDPANRELMLRSGVVICLEAPSESIHERMMESRRRHPARQVRPLLDGEDPLARITALKASRQPFYAECHWTVHMDGLVMEQIEDRVMQGFETVAGTHMGGGRVAGADYVVTTETQSYPGFVGWGILDGLGDKMRKAELAGTAYLVADRGVFNLHGKRAEASLHRAGFRTDVCLVDSGEASKSLASAERIYAWLAERHAERGHSIVSLGGGMAGDLAGFVAATYLRGMPLVHVPTSLLAMVDASIGGKVAVNLPVGKNLVGAFYQPRLVLADAETLTTLPQRELTAGWAEVIKHGLILDADLFAFMSEHRDPLMALDQKLATEAIRRSAAIKARIVSEDEKETTGRRILLNYGHTVGHALEAAGGYGGLLHGEAVAIGMEAAAHISHRTGLLDSASVEAQHQALESFGLPCKAPPVDEHAVRRAMQLDKKVAGKTVRWVLLEGIGHCRVKAGVPAHLVDEALAVILAA